MMWSFGGAYACPSSLPFDDLTSISSVGKSGVTGGFCRPTEALSKACANCKSWQSCPCFPAKVRLQGTSFPARRPMVVLTVGTPICLRALLPLEYFTPFCRACLALASSYSKFAFPTSPFAGNTTASTPTSAIQSSRSRLRCASSAGRASAIPSISQMDLPCRLRALSTRPG